MQSITAGMETLEDNPDEEYYRFIQGVAKTKQEKEKMKALAYIAASERAALGEDQILPMQDHMEMDGYPNGGQGDGMAIGMENAAQEYSEGYQQPKPPKPPSKQKEKEEPKELGIGDLLRKQQLQHLQGIQKTQIGAERH